ncbi:MAG: C/D box methylation guide ribonucleoprotein complex aNOP56 subunit [Desulfurococcaceae archaeon]
MPDKAYIVETVLGILALDENNNLIYVATAPFNIEENVEYLLNIEKGESTPQHMDVFNKLKELGISNVIVETLSTAKIASSYGFVPNIMPGNAIAVTTRTRLSEYAVRIGFANTQEEFFEKMHSIMLEYTRRKLRREAQKRDLLAVQAIRAIDDIDKTINLYIARLREWYSIHFPELDEIVKDHALYAKLVYELGDRSNYTDEMLTRLEVPDSVIDKIVEAAKNSIGAELSDMDINHIKVLAGIILELYNLRDTLEGYIDSVMKEVAPNVTALVGPKLGARLLSLAGGLEKLAKLPASTIQVLGAEKALFRALRTGGKPPKHGVIFQHPAIHKSPKWQRGKIARALAAKLAIAAKIDYFTGRFTGDKLVKEFEARVDEIKKLYPKPPPRVERAPPRERKKKRGERK